MTNEEIIRDLKRLLREEMSSFARTYILNWIGELKKQTNVLYKKRC